MKYFKLFLLALTASLAGSPTGPGKFILNRPSPGAPVDLAYFDTAWHVGTGLRASNDSLFLAYSGTVPGTYGDASHVAQVSVDSFGRVTGVLSVGITGGGGTYTLPIANGSTLGGIKSSTSVLVNGSTGVATVDSVRASHIADTAKRAGWALVADSARVSGSGGSGGSGGAIYSSSTPIIINTTTATDLLSPPTIPSANQAPGFVYALDWHGTGSWATLANTLTQTVSLGSTPLLSFTLAGTSVPYLQAAGTVKFATSLRVFSATAIGASATVKIKGFVEVDGGYYQGHPIYYRLNVDEAATANTTAANALKTRLQWSAAGGNTVTMDDVSEVVVSTQTAAAFPPSGASGGDLSGTYPNPTVFGILGHALPSIAIGYPNWNGSAWVFSTPSGAVTSIFGRTGAVVAAGGDYTPAQVGAEPAITAGTSAQYWNGSKAWTTFPTTWAWSSITGTPTTLSGYGITNGQPLAADLTAISGLAGTGYAKRTATTPTWAVSATVPTTDLSGTLQAAQVPAFTGAITTTAGNVATTLSAGAVGLSNMANIAANSIIGNNTGSPATPVALTTAQTKTLLAIATTDVSGIASYALTSAVPVVATTTPLQDGTAAIGASGKWADGAHVHPTDVSRQAAFTILTTLGSLANGGGALTNNGSGGLSWEASGGMANPMTTTGDMIYSSSGSTPARLAAGATRTVLVGGAAPAWSAIPATTSIAPAQQSIATAAGTTTLAITSPYGTVFTGALAQTVVLPPANTGLPIGAQYEIDNSGTGVVTIQTSGGATLWTLAPGTCIFLRLLTIATAPGTWDMDYLGDIVAIGKSLTVNNSLALTGTDGTTITLPTTSATMARTDNAQTFTGVQTFSSPPTFSSLATKGVLLNSAAGAISSSAGASTNYLLADGTTQALTTANPTTTIGDMVYASSTATPAALARLPAVAAGSLLASAGTGTAPVYTATPSVTTITAKSVAQTVQSIAVSTAVAANLANGNTVIIGASGVPGALTAATTVTFSNPVIGSITRLSFKQFTTSVAVTFTISGYTFYQNGKTAGVASGSAVLLAADMTLSCFYTALIIWTSATTATVSLLKS